MTILLITYNLRSQLIRKSVCMVLHFVLVFVKGAIDSDRKLVPLIVVVWNSSQGGDGWKQTIQWNWVLCYFFGSLRAVAFESIRIYNAVQCDPWQFIQKPNPPEWLKMTPKPATQLTRNDPKNITQDLVDTLFDHSLNYCSALSFCRSITKTPTEGGLPVDKLAEGRKVLVFLTSSFLH